MPIDPILNPNEIERMRTILLAWRQNVQRIVSTVAGFTIVTPLGLQQREALVAMFGRYGLVPVGRQVIPFWPRLATFLYAKSISEEAIARAVVFERIWSQYDPRAELWLLGARDYRDISVWKHEMRRHLVQVAQVVATERGDIPVTLHPFHVPDQRHLASEAQTVGGYLRPGFVSRKA